MMNASARVPGTAGPVLILQAASATDLMTPNPVSIPETATVQEARVLLVDRGIHAAPVINEAGKPVGVVSSTDIVIHDRESMPGQRRLPEFYAAVDLELASGQSRPAGLPVPEVDPARVGDIMTPTVFAVRPDAPAATVIAEMLMQRVSRLFVVDATGVLVGVISTFDILRHLRPE
ncbi:hypothetical protein AYO44_00250 [Planctomycetaceae bacterium SCGC AG-212-F19]|nr:hypothetical protein AYO44_00250 [Planctomycetaceae bacterium SCGC AG-212-F19]